MKQRFLLQYLEEMCQALSDPLLPETKRVCFPNELIPAEALDEDVFFEVFTNDVSSIADTETSSVSTVVGSIVINCRENIGISFVDSIAEALIEPFRLRNPCRKIGFKVSDFDGGQIEDVYVINVERSDAHSRTVQTVGGVDNGRYKITVFVTFEIYEE